MTMWSYTGSVEGQIGPSAATAVIGGQRARNKVAQPIFISVKYVSARHVGKLQKEIMTYYPGSGKGPILGSKNQRLLKDHPAGKPELTLAQRFRAFDGEHPRYSAAVSVVNGRPEGIAGSGVEKLHAHLGDRFRCAKRCPLP
jgi:hypothetical protein